MALGISRSYFGGVFSHQRLPLSVVSSSPRLAQCSVSPHPPRAYATASATLNKKKPVTAKGTRHDAHPPPPSSGKKAAVKEPRKKSTSPEMAAARQASQPNPSPKQVTEEIASKNADHSKAHPDEAEKLKELERMMAFQHLMPTVDAWGQDIRETLDVMIPRSVSYSNSIKENVSIMKDNFMNKMKNATALSQLMTHDSIPNFHPALGWRQQIRQVFQVFGTQSVKPDSLLSPLRKMALDMYEELNEAVANRDERTIKKLTTFSYQKHAIQLSKQFLPKNSRGRLIWTLHRVISPVQILSLRASEGYLAPDEPKTGNRLMVHALVKFDTEQSLEMYNERGVPLHKLVPVPERIVDSPKPKESWRAPAHRKRVTEYLVLERKMWVLGPWQFREQMWPSVDSPLEERPAVE